jgi:putative tricarboxylic transport membrane protein
MRLSDFGLGLFFMALAAAVFAYAGTFPEFPGQRYGPSLFPRVIAVAMFLCGAVIAVRAWRGRGSSSAADPTAPAPLRGRQLASFLAIPLGVVFYLLVADRLGFLPTAALLVSALAWWLGVRALGAVLLGVFSALIIQWFFGSLMRVPLPRGWFMQMIAGG